VVIRPALANAVIVISGGYALQHRDDRTSGPSATLHLLRLPTTFAW
jgi:hypothetical protein